jgi:hypothetical protein
MMIRLYRYLFYRAFDLIKLTGNYDLAWGASHLMSLTFSLFLVNLMILFKGGIEFNILGITGVLMFILIHIINYLVFFNKEEYKNIIESYSKESNQERRIGRISGVMIILVLIYTLF